MFRQRALRLHAISAAIRSGVDLHASLIPFMPPALDPSARGESFQYVTHGGSLHTQRAANREAGIPGSSPMHASALCTVMGASVIRSSSR